MRQKAGSYARNGDFKSASVAANMAIGIEPNHKGAQLYTGRINVELGNYSQAITNVNAFIDLTSSDPPFRDGWPVLNWMLGASIIAETQNISSFTNFCYKLLDQFPCSETNHFTVGERAAKGLLMMNSNSDIISKAELHVMQSISNMNENSNLYDWTCFTLALAKYRMENLEEAEKWAQKSLLIAPESHNWLPGLNNALLSMVYHKKNDTLKSENSLKIAKARLGNLEGNEGSVHDKLLIDLLIKESESLVKK